jgi:hypothetical protein
MRAFGFSLILAAAVSIHAAPVTYYGDVLPVLQKRCQGCHRPGEVAPMSFLTYAETRPWAKAIREAVVLRKMPPWFADPHFGTFSNDRSLTREEMNALTGWADGGAVEGDSKQAPKPLEFVDGWNIGKPDVVLEMPLDFPVPASGTIEYQHFVVPTGFTEDKWVQVAEVRSGNRALVHHAAIFVRTPESKSRWLADLKAGEAYGTKNQQWFVGKSVYDELLTFWVPGGTPHSLQPGQAKLIKAGSDLIFQVHYMANGKAGTDRSRIGLVFAKEPPTERVHSITITNLSLVIPPGVADFPFQANYALPLDVKLVSLNPHMHLRGKSFEFRAIYPTGESEVLLRVPNYSFSWQLYYYLAKQKKLPHGTRIECTAHYDNSPNNPNNPNPAAEVHWGDQSWDEMMVGTMDVAIPPKMDLMNLYPATKAGGD